MWRVDPFQMLMAIAMDIVFGDPRGWPHIARWAGWLSVTYERLLTAHLRRSVLLGVVFWTLVTGTMLAIYASSYRVCLVLHPLAAQILETLVIYQSIAAMDLSRHVKAIIPPLAEGHLATARSRLGRIVGRDTESLDESGISRAAIESVAESTTDGIIAPLFWTLVAGAPAALLYRTVNTLDSMVGHRTEAYEKFGKVSARIDDNLNWVPARICACAFFVFRIAVRWKRIRQEASAHSSPNAGWAEAAMAYAVGVRLGGENLYDGQCIRGPVFNASGRVPAAGDIASSLVWMWRVAGTCAAVFLALSFALKLFTGL
jgi:adenosylcobinamide-phosphate synthase